MDSQHKKIQKTAIYIISACAFLAIGLSAGSFLPDLGYGLALYSAKTFLPLQGLTVSDGEETDLSAAVTVDTTAATPQTTVRESTTEEKKDTEVAALQKDFTATPEDIQAVIAERMKTAASDKKDGSISEKQYKNDGVTDSYQNVRVKNLNETKINIESILKEKADLSVEAKKPSVLIFHTHTTETYQILDRGFYETGFLTRSKNLGVNMVRVGDEICSELEKAGYSVIHDREIHDTKYNGSYSHSRASVEKYLKKYPSIQVVLDIHRDAIQLNNGTKIKPTAVIQGKKAAQIMIISGCQEKGNAVEGFPDWRYNLIFALKLQKALEDTFPGITRPLFFAPRKYNMNLTHCSLLVEVGSDSNTLEEAVYSGKCLGVALSQILKEYEEST